MTKMDLGLARMDESFGTAVGEGILPLREWIKRLKSDRYNGALIIEYNSSKPLTNEIVLSADFLRREICV